MIKYILGYNVRVRKINLIRTWGRLFSTRITNYMIFRFSTSIENFADRVRNQNDVFEWSWKSIFEPTVFLGLYHEGDWLRLILHRGPRLAFWCGGDCLRLQKKPLWQWLINRVMIDHVCENEVEQKALLKMGIIARIHPILFFDDVNKYKVTFKPSRKPHVWLTCHPGREREYGVELVEEIADKVPEVTFHIFGIDSMPEYVPSLTTPHGFLVNPDFIDWSISRIYFPKKKHKNVIYHGQVPTKELDKMIEGYHAGLRTCDFDGCPHTLTKGILLGQYPINRIPYPHTDSYKTKEELIKLLKKLKYKTKPNLEGRKYWLPILTEFPWS